MQRNSHETSLISTTNGEKTMARKAYPRWQRERVAEALETRRVVLLEGPRQSGKTTLSETFVREDAVYRSLDESTALKAALDDPQDFVRHGDELMVIDEIQRAPDLLLAIKMDVDRNQGYGRYLLTGSAHIQSLPTVRESLAGRVARITLRQLAMGEISGKPPDFITGAFRGEFSTPGPRGDHAPGKKEYIDLAMQGGFPEAVRMGAGRRLRRWHADYLSALVDRDLRDIATIRRKDHLMKLVEVLAAWSSKEADIAKIGAKPALARGTVESYINALESMYLVERVRPWHSNDYNRIVKRDKIFMTDSGFMSSLLKWNSEDVRMDGDMNGKLIETFVFNQLSAILDASEEDYELHYFRDNVGREVDLLVRNERGEIVGIEVKAGSSVNNSMFKHLDWFKRELAGGHAFKGVALYTGEQVLSFGEDRWAVPISSLWA